MLGSRSHHTQSTTYAHGTTARPTLMQRLRGRHATRAPRTRRGATKAPLITSKQGHPTSTSYATARTHDTHSRHAAPRGGHAGPVARQRGFWKRKPARVQQRKPSMGDKISGAMLKLRGSLTGRPGKKAAGTRRMHGTDGRGSRRVY